MQQFINDKIASLITAKLRHSNGGRAYNSVTKCHSGKGGLNQNVTFRPYSHETF
jgi:hypothetical protein